MPLDPFVSPESVYALKGNIAIPFEDSRSAATVGAAAVQRLKDDSTASNAGQAVAISAITLPGAVKANR